jgi:hypothetical protein
MAEIRFRAGARDIFLPHSVQIGSGVHTFYLMVTGECFAGNKAVGS